MPTGMPLQLAVAWSLSGACASDAMLRSPSRRLHWTERFRVINLFGPYVVNVTSVPWIFLWAPKTRTKRRENEKKPSKGTWKITQQMNSSSQNIQSQHPKVPGEVIEATKGWLAPYQLRVTLSSPSRQAGGAEITCAEMELTAARFVNTAALREPLVMSAGQVVRNASIESCVNNKSNLYGRFISHIVSIPYN